MDLAKKMSLMMMFVLFFWTTEFQTRTQCNELEECCYIYGSVPYTDDIICVPEGEQVNFNYFIYNPHDNFTNLTVTWFKSITENTSSYEAIPATSEWYQYMSNRAKFPITLSSSVHVENCSHQLTFRDAFSLTINPFTRDKDGYYWCQLAINSTLVQPSIRAYIYAGECNETNYFRLARPNETQCAAYINTYVPLIISPTITLKSPTLISSITIPRKLLIKSSLTSPLIIATVTTPVLSVTQREQENEGPLIYVAGSLSALILLFGALVIVLSVLYLCKFQNSKTTSSKSYQMEETSNTGYQHDATVTVGSSITDVQATVQTTRSTEEDDIYSVVGDTSIGDLELRSSCQEFQSTHALPYEVTVIHGQNPPDDGAENLQYTTGSVAVLQPCDESGHNKHNQQYRENQSSDQTNDEQHVYDEVNHEAKEGKNKLTIPVTNEITCQRDGNNKELATDSELFDDMMYSTHPVQTVDTSGATQQLKINADSMPQQHSEGRNVQRFHAKSTTNMNKDDYAESAALKNQKSQTRFDDKHIYDSANQLSKSQTATVAAIRGDNDTKKISVEADGTKHYHSLTSPDIRSPGYPEMPTGHLNTSVRDTNSQSAGGDPTLYNCQFDDPMYETMPYPGANLNVITTTSSMKADANESQEDESTVQGNPELLQKYSGDAEKFTDAPQHSETSIYDMFDDPTYGVCHSGSNEITENIH